MLIQDITKELTLEAVEAATTTLSMETITV